MRAVNLMDEESARQRHKLRQPYAALLGGADHPRFIVNVAAEWVSVDFLDACVRKYLSYDFREVQPGSLFLKGAYFWEYEGDSTREISNRIFNFEEGGRLLIAERNVINAEVREFETTAAVDENWECYPAFGDYTSLCRGERIKA